jgi:hypothetical protein
MKKILAIVLIPLVAVSLFAMVDASQEGKEKAKAQAKETAKEQAEEKAKETAKKEEAPKHQYVGVSKCAMCHKSKARGDQYGKWQSMKHSQAYAVLATDAAKEVAKKAGIEGDPQKSPKCLKCHVTAHGVDESLLGSKYTVEDGVGCESCHGPGGDYMKLSIMKDQEKAIESGLVVPTEELCVTCHNKESPTYTKFVFKEAAAKIAHPRPKKEE